jgi:hypothetical protein
MIRWGEVIVAVHKNGQRLYDLAERVVPKTLMQSELIDEECHIHLVRQALRSLGVATRRDIADYFRLRVSGDAGRLLDVAIEAAGLSTGPRRRGS